jgi:hypothetical protein
MLLRGLTMDTIQFNTVVGQDQVIRPPGGVVLPQGEIEVIVRTRASAEGTSADAVTATREWLLAFGAAAEREGPDLPADLAANHDHYAHGKPRR